MNLLIQIVQTSIVLYSLILTVTWILIQLLSKSNLSDIRVFVREKILIIALIIYLALSLIFIRIDLTIFPYIHAVFAALIIWMMFHVSQKRIDVFLITTLVAIFMPITIMIATKHPLPLGDDARFPGFAKAIDDDGRWIPYKYSEETYYQFYHLIPALEYILASVTGSGVENISYYYLMLKFIFYLSYFLLIFLILKSLKIGDIAPFIGLFLMILTPPLALTQIVHQGYALILAMTMTYIMLRTLSLRSEVSILMLSILFVSGIIAHATIIVIFLAFLLPLLYLNSYNVEKQKILRIAGLAILISITYWIGIYYMNIILRQSISSITSLINLIFGEATAFHGIAKPWYTQEQNIYFVSWSLVPSIVSSYVLLHSKHLLKILRKNRTPDPQNLSYTILLGLLGLGGTIINFLLRLVPSFGGRYFYWLYILMIPLASMIIAGQRRYLSLILSLIIISIATFYGIQDPTLSANTFGEKIGWANKNDWSIALLISHYIDPYMSLWTDPRLGSPLSSLKPPPASEHTSFATGQMIKIAIIGVDRVGIIGITKDPRNVDWFKRNLKIDPIETPISSSLNNFSMILHMDKYIGIASW